MSDAVISVGQTAQADSINWMPFGISHDGQANVAEYFVPSQEDPSSSTAHLSAHFRGRRLKGAQKQLPDGYQGLVLKPCGANSNTAASDAEQRSWQTSHSFQQLTVWNHDLPPTATDWHMRCIDWMALADKVHAPVHQEQVEQELQRMQSNGGSSLTAGS